MSSIPRLLIAERKKLTFCSFLIRVLDVPLTSLPLTGDYQLIYWSTNFPLSISCWPFLTAHSASLSTILWPALALALHSLSNGESPTAYQNAKRPNRVRLRECLGSTRQTMHSGPSTPPRETTGGESQRVTSSLSKSSEFYIRRIFVASQSADFFGPNNLNFRTL